MFDDFKTEDEEGRIQALKRLEVLDTEEEEPFEKIVGLIEQEVVLQPWLRRSARSFWLEFALLPRRLFRGRRDGTFSPSCFQSR